MLSVCVLYMYKTEIYFGLNAAFTCYWNSSTSNFRNHNLDFVLFKSFVVKINTFLQSAHLIDFHLKKKSFLLSFCIINKLFSYLTLYSDFDTISII